ncbi:DUF3231 family protein [Clostridium psychrophilum]|uniref:DUF3231 family protein n=1 Tax=Clostridium psychrophilum TaxID=132926 RepID=UPI001C0ACDEE|nr:DUF3231 family protein [Clostridium psychrophilum]MBU3181858.1 DUF3231 family protein [Clostridium psychrophilum]
MTTEGKIQLTSTELGTLWMEYNSLSGRIGFYDCSKDKTIEKEAQNLLITVTTEMRNIQNEIVNIFNNQNVVIPIGFVQQDIVKETPPLFDDLFHIMFLRQMSKLAFAHNAIFLAMSYSKEVQDVFKHHIEVAERYYVMSTSYLSEKGVLAKPPYVTMPKQVEFVENKKYMSGYNLFSEKRSLNTLEVGFLNEAIEDNIFGMQLMTGFAQTAKDSEVKKCFIEGKELSKKIISKLSDVLLQSDIQPPSTWAGRATDSTEISFSDKLMMFITNLITNSALGLNSLGSSFSLRSDLHSKLAVIVKDTFDYSKKGGKIMIEHKWMEEPPQMEDRNKLVK